MTRLLCTLTALAATGALMAGCGGRGASAAASGGASATTAAAASSSGSSGAALQLTADESDGLAFDHKTLTAKAGTVTLTLDNPGSGSLPHAIAVEGNGVDSDGPVVQPGGTSKVS